MATNGPAAPSTAEFDRACRLSDAPKADDFETMIESALALIPEPFAARLGSVAIVIDEVASAEQLASVRAHGLYGLYQGVPRTAYGAENAPVPSRITIFRRPLEAHYRDRAALARAVEDVVFHEIAHHFGISDERLRELQAERRRR